ncbi:hypothetical protein TanjilG_04525 [Lupinus angustifolius]|uniref:Uncharacterized protein n=1 Tax=Lupinus angustifolius TaxID=3871 RepID=A0A4P1RQS9_LUPAN|nr:PREDICTED: uncharacterized protein LOC109342999 [Lupinus angustifolius]OIW15990.1 hypothetical protein TanjilG_04525 [Lupinus angustifolius]
MKGTSKVIMGATLVMVVTLAVVLGLILVLLAELYCSLLLRRQRRRQMRSSTTQTTTTTTIPNIAPPPSHTPQQHSPPPFNIYSQGVIQAPRTFLFPPFDSTHDMAAPKNQHQHLSELHQVIQIQENANANASPHYIGLVSAPSSLESFISRAPSKPVQQDSLQGSISSRTIIETNDKPCNGVEHLVYISNPIYENEEGKESEPNTPFETPDTSPSRLERSGSSSDDDGVVVEVSHCGVQTLPSTPLTPMKKLLGSQEACSVSLVGSLGTSGSDSHSNNVLSNSSSASFSTSSSW